MADKATPNKADFRHFADYIVAELRRRQSRRGSLEAQWNEIDRQLAMKPDTSFKMMAGGQLDPLKAWMPEVELPWQAGALEILVADARRMLLPDSGSWYNAHAFLTDAYLDRVDLESLVAGDENEVPSLITQDNADRLVEGWGNHWKAQYPFRDNWDKLNAEAFKYGAFAAVGRVVASRVQGVDRNGDLRSEEQKIPMLVPKSIRNVYLDDRAHRFMGEGIAFAPATIERFFSTLEDMQRAAAKGRRDPQHPNGGWMPNMLNGMEPDKDGYIEVVKYTGDLVIPRKTMQNGIVENVVVWVAVSGEQRVFRFQTKQINSYVEHSYLSESVDTPYGSSPLLKGRPIHKTAVDTLTQFIAWAHLNVQPPLSYQRDDPWFAKDGGPIVRPGETWGSVGPVTAVQIGDGSALWRAFTDLRMEYAEVTGINAARLGAQTVSHTTRFAKDVELSRGVLRTVQYVRSLLQNPMLRWLNLEFELGKQAMSGPMTFWIPEYQGAVTIEKKHLPDDVVFEAFGSGGPMEERAKLAQKLQALQLALSLEAPKRQMDPQARPMDLEHAQREILGDSFADAEIFFAAAPEPLQAGAGANPDLQGAVEGIPAPDAALLAAQ